MSKTMGKVFFSYAREDLAVAEKIVSDLRKRGIDVWFDQISLKGGDPWKLKIQQAIRESAYFVALLSNKSVSKRGHVNNEIREALEVRKTIPESQRFIIPVYLEDCNPAYEELLSYHRIELFPSYDVGLDKLLLSIEDIILPGIASEYIVAGPKNADRFDASEKRENEKQESEKRDFYEIPWPTSSRRAPFMPILLRSPLDSALTITIDALIDTGSQASAVPQSAIEALRGDNLPYDFRRVLGATGTAQPIKRYLLDVEIVNHHFNAVYVLALSRNYALIGRDLLKDMRVLFDGPNEIIRVW